MKGIDGGFAQACHGKATPLKKMKNGDYVIYYWSKLFFNKPEKCQKFTAIGSIFNDEVYSFQMSPNFCPVRIDVEFFPVKDISILPLVNDLQCIENKQKWGYTFRWGTFKINEHDFKLISVLMLYDTRH